MDIKDTIALIISIVSLGISIITFVLKYQKNVNEIITKNRLDWINQVRNLLKDFLVAYINNDENNMRILRNQVALFFRENVVAYSELLTQMDVCINNSYSQQNCDKLILKSQNVFSEMWIRMKREAGISKKTDEKFELYFGNKNRS